MSHHGGGGCSGLDTGTRAAQAFIGSAGGESAQCPGVGSGVGSVDASTWQTALAAPQAGKPSRVCTFGAWVAAMWVGFRVTPLCLTAVEVHRPQQGSELIPPPGKTFFN